MSSAAIFAIACSLFAYATPSSQAPVEKITVLGDENTLRAESGNRIGREIIENEKTNDLTQILKKFSGVYIRQEDGFGLRPNIGLRGTNPDRSKKVVLMEDGVLVAPAPYSAPAAYYSPNLARIEDIAVYKGFEAVEFGPNSIGGAINFISRESYVASTELETEYSAFNSSKLRATTSGEKGRVGYLVNLARVASDGFKELPNDENTGFTQQDFLVKVKYRWNEKNKFALRLGYGNENSNETYLGLSEDDFDDNPYKRYSASSLGNMSWQHKKIHLVHSAKINQNTDLRTTAYNHDFARTWYRLDKFSGTETPLKEMLEDPEQYLQNVQILRGERDSESLGKKGDLIYLRNKRKYYSRGVQSKFRRVYTGENWENTFRTIFRVHQDQIISTPFADSYSMVNGTLEPSQISQQEVSNSLTEAEVISLSVNDLIKWDEWDFAVKGRFEDISIFSRNRITGATKAQRENIFMPGLSVGYQFSRFFSGRVNASKGISVAGIKSSGNEKNEISNNYEIEMRFTSDQAQIKSTVFNNQYDNLTGTCTVSNGCDSSHLNRQFTGGKASIKGLETEVSSALRFSKVLLPIRASHTMIDAKFESTFYSDSPAWGVGQVEQGNPLPYVPTHHYNINIGMEYLRWSQSLNLTYQSAVYDQSIEKNRVQLAGYGVVDWNIRYSFNRDQQVYFKIDNLLNRKYAVASRPFGLRPGKPFTLGLGAQIIF